MCNFDVYVRGSTYMHAVRMYICVISNCMNAVRYTVKTCRLAAPFFQKFAIKIVGAAYLRDHLGKVLLISVNGHFYGIILE